jgi:hypothetical protein
LRKEKAVMIYSDQERDLEEEMEVDLMLISKIMMRKLKYKIFRFLVDKKNNQ